MPRVQSRSPRHSTRIIGLAPPPRATAPDDLIGDLERHALRLAHHDSPRQEHVAVVFWAVYGLSIVWDGIYLWTGPTRPADPTDPTG